MNKLRFLMTKLSKIKQTMICTNKMLRYQALSSGKLDKYEYLTAEDLGYRPDPVQKAKFEYSPLGQVFNKGF